MFEKYADELNIPNKKDAGIDLVATNYSGEYHAIIISTVTDWTDNAINMLEDQTPY